MTALEAGIIPPVEPPPVEPPPVIDPQEKVANVSNIPDLKTALAANDVDRVILANGVYTITQSQSYGPNALWIGSNFAGRTRPVIAQAQTKGGVTFTSNDAMISIGLWFGQGAHDQEWDGFTFDNITGTPIEFGGFTPTAPAHHITLRNILIKRCHRVNSGSNQEQSIYFAHAKGDGPHDLLLEDITIDGSDALSDWAGIHAYHGDASNPPTHDVTIRRLTTKGLTVPIALWWEAGTSKNWLIDGATITDSRSYAIRYESTAGASSGIVFRNVTSTGSKSGGFYSTAGKNPPGVTFDGCSLA